MNWKIKSIIMRACSTSALGRAFYRQLQHASGRIKTTPKTRLPLFLNMADWISAEQSIIKGSTVFEVGTGHLPVVPICFFLCGAEKVITCDLHKRLNYPLTGKALQWLHENKTEIRQDFIQRIDEQTFDQRMELVSTLKDDVETFLKQANIEYLAPADAARTGLSDGSVDIHYSVTVLEHIPNTVIADILKEAGRILKQNGIAAHFVDLSDHFEHQDKSITRINFLKYSENAWNRIAGNEYAYCNRLRPSHYVKTAIDSGAHILRSEATVDKKSAESLEEGFQVNEKFSHLSNDELATRKFNFLLSYSREANRSTEQDKPNFVYDQ